MANNAVRCPTAITSRCAEGIFYDDNLTDLGANDVQKSIEILALQGAQGAQGAQGTPGGSGAQGPQGPQGTQTLAQTLVQGNTTGGTDISVSSGDSIVTPAGSGASAGGTLSLASGIGGTTGAGGDVNITSGAGGATLGNGGIIDIQSGDGGGIGDGGDVSITAGTGSPSGSGGDITITGGVGGVISGNGGDVNISGGLGFSGALGLINLNSVAVLSSFTVATLPAQVAGGMIFVTDETGGAIPAFSDGTNWRRVTDRAIVT